MEYENVTFMELSLANKIGVIGGWVAIISISFAFIYGFMLPV